MNHTASDSPKHLQSLTSLRGIAALWVLLFHLDVMVYYRDLGDIIPHSLSGILTKGYLWVDFFFILSGFILAHVYGEKLRTTPFKQGIPSYLWSRFTRIYPLHIFTLAVLIATTYPIAHFFPAAVDDSWRTYFAGEVIPHHLILIQTMKVHEYLSWNIASWSISAEWWTYILALPLIVGLINRNKLVNLIAMACAFYLLIELVAFKGGKSLDITFDLGFFRCFFEFVIGLSLYSFYKWSLAERFLKNDFTFFGSLIAIATCFHYSVNDLVTLPLFCLLTLASAFNQSNGLKFLSKKPLKYLGDISYSIYLVHSVIFMAYWFSFPHINITLIDGSLPLLTKIVFISSFILITIVVSHYTHRYIEVGMRRKLRALSNKRQDSYMKSTS